MPLYNKEAFVARALDSVLRQSFQDFEIVVVDDGSTDNGPRIVKQYRDPRIRLFRQENAGPGAARNRGIDESRAPLVAFLDADDEYLPGFLEHVVSVMKRYQGCAMCCTGFLIGPNRVDSKVWFGDLPVTERPWRLPTDLHPKWVKRIVDAFVPSTVVARRDILQRYGGFYAKNRCTYGEDTYLWLQVLLNHAVCRIPDALVWWHTECSELGFGRKSPVPPTPTLTDPDALWANCPPEYQSLLERYLAYTSLLTARTLIYSGRAQEAFSLLKSYPSAKVFLWEYTRVRFLDTHLIKGFHLVSRYPPLLRVYRRVKRLASAVCRCQRGKL